MPATIGSLPAAPSSLTPAPGSLMPAPGSLPEPFCQAHLLSCLFLGGGKQMVGMLDHKDLSRRRGTATAVALLEHLWVRIRADPRLMRVPLPLPGCLVLLYFSVLQRVLGCILLLVNCAGPRRGSWRGFSCSHDPTRCGDTCLFLPMSKPCTPVVESTSLVTPCRALETSSRNYVRP